MQNNHIPPVPFAPVAFRGALLAWYDAARRDLPWRARPGERADPYKVWLSEIMLQQTTVKAVIPYFETFMTRWPTAEALAAASRDEVLAAWAGLGYYSRARNLHACAQRLGREGFPTRETDLRTLPGVGAYTAAAIAAIAFGEAAAVVDGNVERVLARVFALHRPLPAAKPVIRQFAAALTPEARPGDYAQAMMDLGATICTPRSPSCFICPVRRFCTGAAEGRPERFPLKAPKPEKPLRRGDAFVILCQKARETHILLRRRKDKGLLGGMMETPCSEWASDARPPGFHESPQPTLAPEGAWREGREVSHTFTHFHLRMRVFAAHRNAVETAAAVFGGEWAPLAKLSAFALPAVMKKAVASGLEALGVEHPAFQRAAGASNQLTDSSPARRAASVSRVDRSARPSTRAGRK